jgi:hypothetical protein
MKVRHLALALATVTATAVAVAACSDTRSPMADDTTATDPTAAHAGHSDLDGAVALTTLPPAGAAAPARHLGPQGRVGQFVVECGFSHRAPDDPIVFPGQPGMSHMHDFFGNESTDADSTLESLLDEATTCQNQLDTASYWAPTLLDDGEPVEPTLGTAYYRAAPGVEPTEVVAFPPGFKVIAGDMTATAEDPRPLDIAGWTCGVTTRLSPEPQNCPISAPLRGVITFPDCWDGERVDSADHRSHAANSADGVCPDTHPVHIPQLTFAITYPISGEDHDLTLASGSVYGLHSDFFNAWDQEELEDKVQLCLHRDAVCGLSSNRGEDPLFSG